MDEAEWLSSTEPKAMLAFLRKSGLRSERKTRLFAAAVCRRIWELLTDQRSQEAVLVLERLADGLAEDAEARKAISLVSEAHFSPRDQGEDATWAVAMALTRGCSSGLPATDPVFAAGFAARAVSGKSVVESTAQAALLRCIHLNPFRPLPPLAPSVFQWQEGTVVRLAQAAYEERELPSGHLDRARLAVLADALEEAGGEPELVGHLRGPGSHCRGCWALDCLLARE